MNEKFNDSPLHTRNLNHPYNLNHPQGIPNHKETIKTNKLVSPQSHTHTFYGKTSNEHDHIHLLPIVTGTSISTSEGHVHYINGLTTFDNNHIHSYEAYTSPSIELPNGYHTHFISIKTTLTNSHFHTIKGFLTPVKIALKKE